MASASASASAPLPGLHRLSLHALADKGGVSAVLYGSTSTRCGMAIGCSRQRMQCSGMIVKSKMHCFRLRRT